MVDWRKRFGFWWRRRCISACGKCRRSIVSPSMTATTTVQAFDGASRAFSSLYSALFLPYSLVCSSVPARFRLRLPLLWCSCGVPSSLIPKRRTLLFGNARQTRPNDDVVTAIPEVIRHEESAALNESTRGSTCEVANGSRAS